jgi:hypothetical protein
MPAPPTRRVITSRAAPSAAEEVPVLAVIERARLVLPTVLALPQSTRETLHAHAGTGLW